MGRTGHVCQCGNGDDCCSLKKGASKENHTCSCSSGHSKGQVLNLQGDEVHDTEILRSMMRKLYVKGMGL